MELIDQTIVYLFILLTNICWAPHYAAGTVLSIKDLWEEKEDKIPALLDLIL